MTSLAIKEDNSRLEITLPSTLEAVDRVIIKTTEFITRQGFAINSFTYAYILREALNNAVIHGNRKDESLLIKLTIAIQDTDLVISVCDKGDGFDWRTVIKREQTSPEATSGRGLYSMQQYHFDLSYNDKGNELYLRKKLES